MKKQKWNRIYIYLMLAYIVLPLVLLVAIHHISLLDTIMKMDQGYFGSYYTYLSVQEENFLPEDLKREMEQSPSLQDISFAMIQEEKQNSARIRGIFYTNNYVRFPMEEGRFLLPEDFVKDNCVCVVGKNYQDMIYQDEGKKWIDLCNQPYEVLGIMGYEEESILNEYIYINGLTDYPFQGSIYLFDCTSLHPSENELSEFIEEQRGRGRQLEEISGGYCYGESITVHIWSAKWFALLLCCTLLGIMIMTVQWVRVQRRKIAMKQLLGAEDSEIFKEICFSLLGMLLVSFVITYCVCHRYYPYYLSILWKIYVVHMLVTILTSGCMTKYLCTQSIVEVMNR